MRILIAQIIFLFDLPSFGQRDTSEVIICTEFTSKWEVGLNLKIQKAQHLSTEIVILDSSSFTHQKGIRDTLILYAVETLFKKGEKWLTQESLRLCWTSNPLKFYEVKIQDYDFEDYQIGAIEDTRVEIFQNNKHYAYLTELLTWKETVLDEFSK